MDWKRAKTILILAFIAINIVLAVTLYQNIKVGEISKQTIDDTQKILQQNNIHIECPIPKYAGKDSLLQYEDTKLDKKKIIDVLLVDNYSKISDNIYEKGKQKLTFTGDSSFEFTDSGGSMRIYSESKSEMDAYLKDLSKKLLIPFNEFQLDDFYTPPSGKGVTAIYMGVYNGYSVYDNYIEAEVSDSSIMSLKYHYKRPMTITGRDINVIPVYQILITRMTKYPGIYIKEVDLGFKGLTKVDKETKTLYEGLSWRIKTYTKDTTEGKDYYFNATNGEEMEY